MGSKAFVEMAKASVAVAALAFLAVAAVALGEGTLRNVTLDFSDPARLADVFLAHSLYGEGARKAWGWDIAAKSRGADEGSLFLNLSVMYADYVVLGTENTTEFFGDTAGFVNLSFYYRPLYAGHMASVGLETLFEDGSPDETVTICLRDDGAAGTGDFEARTESVGDGWLFVTARNIAEIPRGRQMVLYVSNMPTVGSEPFGLYLKGVRMGVGR